MTAGGHRPEADAMERMVHELLAHQAELELQNEQLIESRDELRANAELLGGLYDYAPAGYFSLSAAGFIRQLNFMGATMLGREREALLGTMFAEFISPRDRPVFDGFLARVFSGARVDPCELELLRDGQDPVIASLTGGLSPNGMVCRMAAMDVTALRRVEAAVREKNEDLERIFSLSHDLLGIAGQDGRFRRINPAFERVLGHGGEVLTGHDFLNFVHPDDMEGTVRMMSEIREGREVLDFVNRYRCADGSYCWLEWRATPYGDGLICALARDITGRKLAEDALRVSEEKFRSIVESSPMAMHLYQIAEDGGLVLIGANPAADQELGIEHRALIGRRMEQAFPQLAATGIPQTYQAVANGVSGPRSLEVCYDDGEIAGCFDVRVFQTHPGMIAVAFADISERKSIQKALERAQEELEAQVQRRTAQLHERTLQLRSLANQLTHAEEQERKRISALIHEDLQQMLGAALLHVSLLKSKASCHEATEDISRIEGILRDSIKTARSLSAELSPPVLQQGGLEAALKWLRTWYGEKYALDVRIEVEEAADPGPEVSLTLCVRELLFNIIKHSGVREAALRMWSAPDGVLCIEVVDEGSGFDPEEVRSREGSAGGIGLFGIRERLELLGGGLEIESSPGSGSRFRLRLPVKPQVQPTPGSGC